MESLESERIKKVKKREISNSIAEQIKIQEVSPKIQELSKVGENIERAKHLDKCRRLIAYNTLK